MQTEELIGLMTGQAVYNSDTLSRLSEVVAEYPYFPAAHLLYTLNFLELQDTHFSVELRKTAAYLNDRKKIFYLVENQYFAPEFIEKSEKKEAPETGSSFDLIELFLTDKNRQPPMEHPAITTDYISYYLSGETGTEIPEAPPMQHQEVIDKFLNKDKITPVKLHLKEPEKSETHLVPDLDTVDENNLFSETLAKIYLKQKKYDRALVIIRKLNLIYPEKSRYFADQIRFLEKLIINTKK
ncbi:hypothetical protein FACS189432_01200 [Bacteroidia bacterium]|nr:hypothetical protein FACS189426_03460 [Bacteroidia bacterium]GHT26551.1 hypothetical protein FACS189432_01200 [Bacteroidia bacterium]GHV71076.1 hypothetical protein FACS189420_4780 [Bacteroidia bacterium]